MSCSPFRLFTVVLFLLGETNWNILRMTEYIGLVRARATGCFSDLWKNIIIKEMVRAIH